MLSTPLQASAPYRAAPGPTITSIPARSTLGVAVNCPTGRPFSGSTITRPSSIISIRLLNDELKPRALTATLVVPTWMKSSPFACLSAPTKVLPTVFSSTSVPMRVMVTGASVTRSARREALTTTPSRSTGVGVSGDRHQGLLPGAHVHLPREVAVAGVRHAELVRARGDVAQGEGALRRGDGAQAGADHDHAGAGQRVALRARDGAADGAGLRVQGGGDERQRCGQQEGAPAGARGAASEHGRYPPGCGDTGRGRGVGRGRGLHGPGGAGHSASSGSQTSASPSTTASPSWLEQAVRRRTRRFAGNSSATSTRAVTVSPMRTGRRKRSDCDR